MTDTPNTSADERERMARVVAGHGFDKVAAMLRADAATIAEQQATIERMRAGLTLARNTFEAYAGLHREKGTHDGDAKAALNNELAKRMNAALASTNRSDAAGEGK